MYAVKGKTWWAGIGTLTRSFKQGCDIDIVCNTFSVGWGGLVQDKQEKKEKEKKEREVYQNGKLIKKWRKKATEKRNWSESKLYEMKYLATFFS